MVQIAPSILAADFLHLNKDVELVNLHADLFHLDVMDGTFVPNISFGFPVIHAIASVAVKPMDAHLMIVHPEKYVARFAAEGVSMLSFHLEAAGEDTGDVIRLIRENGMVPGLAINPDVPVESLYPYLDSVGYVLIMSVFAGFGGQRFIEESYGRIAAVKREIDRRGLSVAIEVDGGVGAGNAAALAAAGADILVAGSAVFKAEDPAAAILALR